MEKENELDMFLTQLGGRIRKVRKLNNLSQAEFASRLDVKQGHVSSLETGKATPSGNLLASICLEFAIKYQWLFDGKEPMEQNWAPLKDELKDLKIPISLYLLNKMLTHHDILSNTVEETFSLTHIEKSVLNILNALDEYDLKDIFLLLSIKGERLVQRRKELKKDVTILRKASEGSFDKRENIEK